VRTVLALGVIAARTTGGQDESSRTNDCNENEIETERHPEARLCRRKANTGFVFLVRTECDFVAKIARTPFRFWRRWTLGVVGVDPGLAQFSC
jgi:hypothetical protein